jgi:hypothetical protein
VLRVRLHGQSHLAATPLHKESHVAQWQQQAQAIAQSKVEE